MKKLVITLAGLLAFSGVFMSCAATSKQQADIQPEAAIKAHEVIRVHYISGIDKPELAIQPGTTVVWMNDSRASVEIQFEGEQVTIACKSPVHFVLDENGSFISDRIPEGSVASLCFVETGTFDYVVRKATRGGEAAGHYRGPIKKFKGKVVVQ